MQLNGNRKPADQSPEDRRGYKHCTEAQWQITNVCRTIARHLKLFIVTPSVWQHVHWAELYTHVQCFHTAISNSLEYQDKNDNTSLKLNWCCIAVAQTEIISQRLQTLLLCQITYLPRRCLAAIFRLVCRLNVYCQRQHEYSLMTVLYDFQSKRLFTRMAMVCLT
jgi:hypothetical protein